MIGEKIKFIRTEKGITGKELAEKAEVTPGYISQIERNLISPSRTDADCRGAGNPLGFFIYRGRGGAGDCHPEG